MPDSDETSIARLAAWYVSDEELSPAELRAHLAEAVPDYMLPAQFFRLARLPITSNGKVDRSELPTSSDVMQPPREVILRGGRSRRIARRCIARGAFVF